VPVIATVPEPTPVAAVLAPGLTLASALKFTREEIEQIVLQYLREHGQLVAVTPAAAEPAEPRLGYGERKVSGSDRPVVVEPRYLVPVDPASGREILTPEQIEEKLSRDLEAAIRSHAGQRGTNPQASITQGKITSSVHEYKRR
jgi:hypothetical protein